MRGRPVGRALIVGKAASRKHVDGRRRVPVLVSGQQRIADCQHDPEPESQKQYDQDGDSMAGKELPKRGLACAGNVVLLHLVVNKV